MDVNRHRGGSQMNTIEIVISVCSILQGAACSEKTLTFNDVSLMTCMVHSQPVIAQWHNENPNYSIHRWECRVGGQFAKA